MLGEERVVSGSQSYCEVEMSLLYLVFNWCFPERQQQKGNELTKVPWTPVQAGDFPKFPSQKTKTSLEIRGELCTEGKTKLTDR